MNQETSNLDAIIKNLKCMSGIGAEYIPSFKFFQFKKSKIKDSRSEYDKIMLCFSDISQKILYDTSKAEGELLSLINSTISHEMRNPLNSIINQCKIIFFMLQQFHSKLASNENTVPSGFFNSMYELYEEMSKSASIMTSSSNLLLLSVEDILGYA